MTHLMGRDPDTGRVVRVDVEDGLIAAITEVGETVDSWIAPGLIDLQVNGFNGYDLNRPDLDVAVVSGLVRSLREVGVTSVAPTLITAAPDRLIASLKIIAAARASAPEVARAIPFVHIEGPFLSDVDGPRGVHDRAHIRPPDIDEVARWQRAAGGDLVGVVTMSPHWDDSAEFIREVTARGVAVAIGHTHATSEQIHLAADAGATMSTHLGNGAHAKIARHPNYIWAQLADDRLSAGLIADGHHLPTDTFVVMLRAMGLGRVHLVSDSTELAGLPPGRYPTAVGTEVELSRDGRISKPGTSLLAGAGRSLNEDVATAIPLGRLTLGQSLRLATANPGRLLRAGGPERGVLRVGASADLMTFGYADGDDHLQVERIIAGGVEYEGLAG